MLTKVWLAGFKAVKDSGDVSLGPLTLFIGRNGSGKSSFIEGLQWFQESIIGGIHTATTERFGAYSDLLNRRCSEIALHVTFQTGTKEVRYDLRVQEGSEHRPVVAKETCREGRTRGTATTIRSRNGRVGPSVRSILGGNPVRDGDTLALSHVSKTKATGAERLLAYMRDAIFLRLSPTAMAKRGRLRRGARDPLLDEEGRNIAALLSGMTPEDRNRVSAQIAEIIEGVQGVKVIQEGDLGHFATREKMRSKGGTRTYDIPSWLLSEGTRRLTAIFALLATLPRPSLLAIEEVENGLDPWTLEFVFRALREAAEEGIQILLTTHSPFLLDHVQPEEVIYVARERGDTTYTVINTLQDVARNRGVLAPGAMYISGYLQDAGTDQTNVWVVRKRR